MLDLLPREILFEILSRLPVKFLPRVKCVCKAMLCLISDPIFAMMIASRGPKFIISLSSDLKSMDCSKTSFTDQGALINLDFPPIQDEIINISSIDIVGSCNGLVCVALKLNNNKNSNRELFLWNPSTGIHRKLPDLVLNLNGDVRIWGFGYDSSINDYKVVCATIASSGRHPCDVFSDYRDYILATKTDSWRELIYDDRRLQSRNAYRQYQLLQGTLLNGALHWLTNLFSSHYSISAFDLTEEEFNELPLMPNVKQTMLFGTVSVLDGRLCLVCSSRADRYVELWTMKEYGVESSWQKLFRLAENFNEINYHYNLQPLRFTTQLGADQDNDEIVFLNNKNELIRFKAKDRTLERLIICRSRIAQAIMYEESLVSPKV